MERLTLSKVKELATEKGLSIDSYNPGDGITYKVDTGIKKTYFQMRHSAFRTSSLRKAYNFINKQ